MDGMSRAEKSLFVIASLAFVLSVYLLGGGSAPSASPVPRGDLALGQISVAQGDTSWKSATQKHHYRTWKDQRLYVGDTLQSGAASRLGFYLGEIHVDLKAHTRVSLAPVEERLALEAVFGEFEIHLPPGARIRLRSANRFLDLASVNGGRVLARVEIEPGSSGKLRVQNIAGDLVARSPGSTEVSVPEEQFFSVSQP